MQNNHQKKDAELIELALKDQDQFVHLVERYEDRLLRYLRRFTGFDKDTSEDILQEVFIKVYKNLNNFDSDLSFSSWAYRIAHNEAINFLRKEQKFKVIPLEDEEGAINLIEILQSDVDIVRDFSKKELSTLVSKVLSMLSPKYREILIFKYLEEMNYAEISDVLKIPIGTVGTLISRAKDQFKLIAEKNKLYTH